jgi:predicted RNA-binding Zn ribbon-like protein
MARALVQPVTDSLHPLAEPGELRFRFDTGRPCLDLVITVGERWRRSFERLRSTDDLARWLGEAGMARTPPPVSATDLADARELREAIFRLARAAMDGMPATKEDVRTVNAWASRPDLAPRFDRIGGGVQRSAPTTMNAALATLARDAADLFGGPDVGRIRECSAPDCSSVFLDTSRAGRRRWCSMATCGNRQKVAAYRRRRTSPGARTRRPSHSPLERSTHDRAAPRRG